MLFRRFIEHIKVQIWTVAIALIISPVGAVQSASANALPANELPQYVLDACDTRAMPYGGYDKKIAASVEALTDLGVFETAEFYDVKIGWCDLRKAQGPAATTSCAGDTILLDSGYAKADQALVRSATLAHEMKHVLQHRAQKASHGDAYCDSDQYASDKDWMEADADAFGDGVAELFFTGRAVEIKNECPAAVSIYLEADKPMAVAGEAIGFIEAPPLSATSSPERSTSRFFNTYAKIAREGRERELWGGAAMAIKRDIAGKTYGLAKVALTNADRSKGPFQMILSCARE